VATAYYSPLPDQTHYAMGSYEADIAMNGHGIAGNDGTPVYPGMIAAPQEFAFGTRIELPELGVIGSVHDRGSMITVDDDGVARLDLWMGHGEQALARAMEWGVRRVKGHVYAPKAKGAPEESFDLAKFAAPASALEHLPSNPITLLGIGDPKFGDTSSAVAAMQHALKTLGYFDHAITSEFGEVTRGALALFQRDLRLEGKGDVADETTRRALVAHRLLAAELAVPLPGEDILLRGTSGKSVRVLQRMLLLLGKYSGEIDGIYDQDLLSTVFEFQKEHTIVKTPGDAGAGMVGPQTRRAFLTAWRQHRITKRGEEVVLASAPVKES
ncbi:MAG: peptidoglycan-binding protein, partial [Patescibacteria group bacterium]